MSTTRHSNLDIDFDVEVDDETVSFGTSQGFFRCSEYGRPKWCDHLVKVVADNLDAPSWPSMWNNSEGLGWGIEVPIIPSVALFQRVQILPVKIGKSLTFNAAEIEISIDNAGGYGEYLGYMNEGDGIGSLRFMIIDWFEGTQIEKMVKTNSACRSASHKMDAQRQWVTSINKGGAQKVAQFFCLWSTGKCMICQKGASGDWDDAFIPDVEKRSGWNG